MSADHTLTRTRVTKARRGKKPTTARGEQLQRLENEGRDRDEQGRDSEADPNATETDPDDAA